jgi:hypothetical protein
MPERISSAISLFSNPTADVGSSSSIRPRLRVYRGDRLLLALPLSLEEHAERRPAPITTAQKRKTPMPRIYNLSGRPALAAVT